MSVYVFLGPTLPLAEARSSLDAVYLPPVRQGDVYRLVALKKPQVIGIVDGYFNQVPAVWHKEILWALASGVHVYGAASMGALRAAELAPFGMHGVGRIFEAYRDGRLPPFGDEAFEDDDEVAVVHGPGESGYAGLSEAMVNIRCTLAAAWEAGVIRKTTRDELARLAKSLFYPERDYRRLLAVAAESGLPADEVAAFGDWLGEGKRDQKRDDALALLRTLERFDAADAPPNEARFAFQHTAQWEAAVNAVEFERSPSPHVLEELRLEGERFFEHLRTVLQRLFAVPDGNGDRSLGEALRAALAMPATEVFEAAFNAAHGQPDAVEKLWQLEQLLMRLRSASETLPWVLLDRQLVQLLEERGERERLAARAREKQALLEKRGTNHDAAELTGLQELQLHDWYFEQRLGRSIPEDVAGYAAQLGFAGVDDLNRALLREYFYLKALESET